MVKQDDGTRYNDRAEALLRASLDKNAIPRKKFRVRGSGDKECGIALLDKQQPLRTARIDNRGFEGHRDCLACLSIAKCVNGVKRCERCGRCSPGSIESYSKHRRWNQTADEEVP